MTMAARSRRPLRRRPVSTITGSAKYLVLNVEFDTAESLAKFNVPGATIFARKDQFADMFIEPRKEVLDQVDKAGGLVWIEEVATLTVPPPPTVPRSPERAKGEERTEEIVRGGIDGLTGKGTIIAIVDSGVDFRNPDFITYDSANRPTSRLLYLWDTVSQNFDAHHVGSRPPLSYPNRAAIGTLYSQAQLTAALRAEQAGRTSGIPETDLGGHGTACAGVAAGNGNNSRNASGQKRDGVIGVASEADIIAVRIADGRTPALENAFLLNAICDWLDSVAGKKPLVVSCSFGGHRGGHDGRLILERALDARFPFARQRRAITIAAGNEATQGIHAEAILDAAHGATTISWQSDKGAAPVVQIYLDTNDTRDIKLALDPAVAAQPLVYINPISQQAVIVVQAPPGQASLSLSKETGATVKADLYIAAGEFSKDRIIPAKQIGSPGTSSHAITVGSYDWNPIFSYGGRKILVPDVLGGAMSVGQLSIYSNPGFSRQGSVKPEIVSPGEYYAASWARKLDHTGVGAFDPQTNKHGLIPDSSGKYILFNGTSAAAPYTAGIIALMFERKPTLTLGEIRELLKREASHDRFTSEIPNPGWGNGKLDLKAVRAILSAIR
jgi:subtilisin family serine protease